MISCRLSTSTRRVDCGWWSRLPGGLGAKPNINVDLCGDLKKSSGCARPPVPRSQYLFICDRGRRPQARDRCRNLASLHGVDSRLGILRVTTTSRRRLQSGGAFLKMRTTSPQFLNPTAEPRESSNPPLIEVTGTHSPMQNFCPPQHLSLLPTLPLIPWRSHHGLCTVSNRWRSQGRPRSKSRVYQRY